MIFDFFFIDKFMKVGSEFIFEFMFKTFVVF